MDLSVQRSKLTGKSTRAACQAAVENAEELGIRINVSVVDS